MSYFEKRRQAKQARKAAKEQAKLREQQQKQHAAELKKNQKAAEKTAKEEARRAEGMNRPIRQLGAALLVLFALLFARLNYVQFYAAEDLTSNGLNSRRVIRDFGQRRGAIITQDGLVIAESVASQGRFARERQYSNGRLFAHITGYFSFEYGATGVERYYNDDLAGQSDEQQFASFWDFFGDGDASGDVVLTINSQLQQVAAQALGQRRGTVIALDPRNGEIKAYYSFPTFDPSTVSMTDLDSARQAKLFLDKEPERPLLTRAHREVYPPGSVFKIVTAAAALESGLIGPNAPVFAETDGYRLPLTNFDLSNYGGRSCGGSLVEALARSCNTTFAEIAAEYLGPEPIISVAERFGFNETPPIDLPLAATSRFPTDFGDPLSVSEKNPDVSIYESTSLLAQAGIGQYEVAASPLQMAIVASAIAYDGAIAYPHVMSAVLEASETPGGGRILHRFTPTIWRKPISTQVADRLEEMMVAVVTNGTARTLQRPGLRIGAKTGTAQTNIDATNSQAGAREDTHAWMVAFAGPQDGKAELVVAVMVEAVPGGGQQTGSGVAGPITAAIIDAYFGS